MDSWRHLCNLVQVLDDHFSLLLLLFLFSCSYDYQRLNRPGHLLCNHCLHNRNSCRLSGSCTQSRIRDSSGLKHTLEYIFRNAALLITALVILTLFMLCYNVVVEMK